jgi:hypothetical protein
LGKSKQRLRARARNEKTQLMITREEALKTVCENLIDDASSISARKLISLFGLTAEELAEAGVTYEILRSLDGLIT